MLIIAGTSLQVYPAANFISNFCGKHLVVINKEKLHISLDDETDLFICESMGKIFKKLNETLFLQ